MALQWLLCSQALEIEVELLWELEGVLEEGAPERLRVVEVHRQVFY